MIEMLKELNLFWKSIIYNKRYAVLLLTILGCAVCSFSSAFFFRLIKSYDNNIDNSIYQYTYSNYSNQCTIDNFDINKYDKVWLFYDTYLDNVGVSSVLATSDTEIDAYGMGINEDNILSGDNVIILSQSLYRKYYTDDLLGKHIDVNGEIFKVVGYNDSEYSYIPFTYKIKSERFSIKQISIFSRNSLNKYQLMKISEAINMNYEGSVGSNNEFLAIGIVYMSICLAVCLFNVFLVFRYYVRKNEFKYTIYQICGARKYAIRLLILLEGILPALVGFILGLLINISMNDLQNTIFENSYYLKLKDICVLFIINFIGVLINIFYILYKHSKLSLIDKRRWI